MNPLDILEAMENVEDGHIIRAGEKLGYCQNREEKRPWNLSVRRWVACAAIAAVLGSLCLMTAMAVSDEFRQKVYSFFRVGEEVIPQPTVPAPETQETEEHGMFVEPEKILIGEKIEGTYVHTPTASHARNGVFLICTDPVMMNSGNHYDAYAEVDGELIKLEEQTFCQDYRILGNDFHVEFQWVDAGESCVYTYIESEAPWRKQNLSGPVEATLFLFPVQITGQDGTRYTTEYPVIINVRTGELTDILEGTGAEKIPYICSAAISEDRRYMVLVTEEGRLYCVDIGNKRYFDLDEVSAEHVQECALTENAIVCWRLEKDPKLANAEFIPGTFKVWAIDLTTGERREIYRAASSTTTAEHIVCENYEPGESHEEGLHFIEGFNKTSHWGNMYSGSIFALEVDAARKVYVVDLATGEKSLIDGFLWPQLRYPDLACIPSPDGKKLLIECRTAMNYYEYIGVLDFESKTYFEFSRENLKTINEHTVYWFDHNSILIGTSGQEGTREYYVYRLLK